jgi:hypothetical protein
MSNDATGRLKIESIAETVGAAAGTRYPEGGMKGVYI